MCKGLVVGCAFLLRIHPKISCKSFSVFFETPNLPQMLLHILKYLFAREFHKINSLHLSLKYFLLKYALATNSIHTLEKMILDTIPWCIESKIRTYSPTNKNSQEKYSLSSTHTKAVYCVFSKAALICNDCQVAEFVNDDFLHRFPTITHCKTAVLWI